MTIKRNNKAAKTVNKTTSKSVLTDKQIDAIAAKTGEVLSEQDKINVIIPKLEGESDTVECCINGYNYVIKKGEMVALPKAVVDVLRHARLV